ncbi:MAG: PTS sugar transporter subunit IIA [Candidatus Omnitrophica bacterium]|nr:PTS sugar transporter subunit IIA [Candidatus Omnitrophota bacterium]
MNLTDFISRDAVTINLKSQGKEDVIAELVELLVETSAIDRKHKKKIVEILMAREALGSTAIGQGIAIPHGKYEGAKQLIGCLGISKKGVDFDSLDGEPAHIFFLLIAPADSAGPHLKALARISRLLKDKFIRESLKSAKDEKEMMAIIEQEDARLSAA